MTSSKLSDEGTADRPQSVATAPAQVSDGLNFLELGNSVGSLWEGADYVASAFSREYQGQQLHMELSFSSTRTSPRQHDQLAPKR